MTLPPLEALLAQARAFEGAGRWAEAAAAYQELLARRPDLPNSWYNLARLQRRLGQPDAALASYQRALDHRVEGPEEVRLNRGVIFADDLRRPDEAERELRAAVALAPGYVPALINLANLAEDRGRRDEAAALYEQILSLDPRCWLALARYAGVRPPRTAGDPLIARLREGSADPAVEPADRTDLAFALGKALDGCAAYDEAFVVYTEANRLSRRMGGPGAVYDRAAEEALVDRVIAAFTAERMRDLQTASQASPIFICGMFRSGSTLTEQILAAHPAVAAGGELEVLPRLVNRALSPFPERFAAADRGLMQEMAAAYGAQIARLFPGASAVTDKRLDNLFRVGLIKTLFPRAKVVLTRRNPLDNILSVFFLHVDPSVSYALDLADAAHHLRQQRRLAAHWRSLFGDEVLDFSYDALVREPRAGVERLLAYCGLPWDDACLRFHELDNAVRTASVWQVREPLHARSSERWRHYARQLEPLRAELEDVE